MTVIPFPSRNTTKGAKALKSQCFRPAVDGRINRGAQRSDCQSETRVSAYEAAAASAPAIYQEDAATKSVRQLAALYPATYSTWKRIRYTDKAPMAEEVRGFAGFLREFGPPRHDSLTLDRINNADLLYAPGRCRWATPEEQARNRSTTIMLTCPATGETRPLVEWAELKGWSPDKLRRQRREGWTDAEILAGRRGGAPVSGPTDAEPAPSPARVILPDPDPRKRWPWALDTDRWRRWEDAYRANRREFETGYEWRMEFALRTWRAILARESAKAEQLREGYDDFEVSAPAHVLEEYRREVARVAPLKQRMDEVHAAFPAWSRDSAGLRREPVPASW